MSQPEKAQVRGGYGDKRYEEGMQKREVLCRIVEETASPAAAATTGVTLADSAVSSSSAPSSTMSTEESGWHVVAAGRGVDNVATDLCPARVQPLVLSGVNAPIVRSWTDRLL